MRTLTYSKIVPVTGIDCLLAVQSPDVSWRFKRLLHCGFLKATLIKCGGAPVQIMETIGYMIAFSVITVILILYVLLQN